MADSDTSRPKVFQIGFNKSATTSLHLLFQKSGYRSVHGGGRQWRIKGHPAFQKTNIHRVVRDNIAAGRRPVEGFEEFDAFFDMEQTGRHELIHNYLQFEAFATAYPNSKFILNFRNLDAWVQSRLRHGDGTYAFRMRKYHDTDEDGLVEIWRDEYTNHMSRVEAYFKEQPERLFMFRLEDSPVQELCEFVKPEYQLKPQKWRKARASASKATV